MDTFPTGTNYPSAIIVGFTLQALLHLFHAHKVPVAFHAVFGSCQHLYSLLDQMTAHIPTLPVT